MPRLVPQRIDTKAILHFKPHFISLAHACLNGTTHQRQAVGNHETDMQGKKAALFTWAEMSQGSGAG